MMLHVLAIWLALTPPLTGSDAWRDSLRAQPTAPLDPRVDASRVTTLAAPPVPERLTPPPPVIRRIAFEASQVPLSPPCFETARTAIDRGLAYLRASQGSEGGWMAGKAAQGSEAARSSNAASVAVTGLVIRAFAQAGRTELNEAAVRRGVARLLEQTSADGKFDPDPAGGLGTYVASCAVLGLAALESPERAEALQRMVAWLRAAQWDQPEGIRPEHDWFGGVGYGKHGRPDLSNTQMMLEALHESGAGADDAAVQRALAFVARCQNRKGEDAAPWANAGASDGGFVYTVANGGESFASEVAGEGRYGEKLPPDTRSLRSYGSMTYAGYKSLLFAGLSGDDPRVQAALAWAASHWTLAENPGLGQQGLFYYRMALSRAMLAGGVHRLRDAHGTDHDWRCELIRAVVAEQRADGSWVNGQDRWMEGEPDLVTAYALLALEEAIKPSRTLE
jgi:squalene-hopene/tetraprenyl-beta-curcumene cyclase